MASARRLLLASLVLLAAAAVAGCLASDGPVSASSSADAPRDGGQASTSGGSSGGASGGASQDGSRAGNGTASGNATTAWRNQTRTGGFSGANAVVLVFGKTESFPVSEDAVNLTLVVRAPDVELSGSISPPCESGGFGGCPSRSYETNGGTYTYRTAQPDAGDWSVSFFRGETGVDHQRYILEIHRQVRTPG